MPENRKPKYQIQPSLLRPRRKPKNLSVTTDSKLGTTPTHSNNSINQRRSPFRAGSIETTDTSNSMPKTGERNQKRHPHGKVADLPLVTQQWSLSATSLRLKGTGWLASVLCHKCHILWSPSTSYPQQAETRPRVVNVTYGKCKGLHGGDSAPQTHRPSGYSICHPGWISGHLIICSPIGDSRSI